MNLTLSRLQNNKFLTLIPVVLLLTYALAYLVRMILIVFLHTPASGLTSSYRSKQARTEVIKSLSVYEEVVSGNLVRGIFLEPGTERTISGTAVDLSAEAPEDPDL